MVYENEPVSGMALDKKASPYSTLTPGTAKNLRHSFE